MKSTLTTLTFLVAALAIAPRPSYGQYAWVPVYSEPAAVEAYNSAPGQSGYATYVGEELEELEELEEFDQFDDQGPSCDVGCKTGCECPSCRHAVWLGRTFAGFEYLHWWNKGRNLPPLVTGGPDGILPGSPILFGGQAVGGDLQAGARFTVGLWLDDCENSAVVVRAFGNEGDNTLFGAATPGTPFIAVPYQSTFPPLGPQSIVIGDTANNVPGTINSSASNDVLGGDIYYRTLLDSGCDYRIDLLGGFQYDSIHDDLTLATASPGGGLPQFASLDSFRASNKYAAGEFGLLGEYDQGPVTLQMMGKIGIGNMRQRVAIDGAGSFNNIMTPGGIFAQPPQGPFPFNGGVHTRDVLTWSPEASVKLIWRLRENISMTVGYTFLYWSNVALAGDHVNTSIDTPVIFGVAPTSNNPSFAFRATDFWVQTIDLGFAIKY